MLTRKYISKGQSICIVLNTLAIILTFCTSCTFASNGDRSYVFGKCVHRCLSDRCSNFTEFSLKQPLHMNIMRWSCQDECKYDCMWSTVDAFQRDGSHIPQFYGKWPFVRYAGIQEPASMIFSLLNALSHIAIFYYRAKVPSSTPMYKVWHGMAVVGVVTWLCAAIFHTRDTPLTERMDYFSAFGLVLFNLFTLICRVLGTHRMSAILMSALSLIVLYCYHIYYLQMIHFDYGYNMIVNITVGAINGSGWIIWSLYHYKQRKHWWKCVIVILGLNILLTLELGDFPPVFWTFDAHAIWHAGTVPLNLLWYSFIIDDSLQDLKMSKLDDFKKML